MFIRAPHSSAFYISMGSVRSHLEKGSAAYERLENPSNRLSSGAQERGGDCPKITEHGAKGELPSSGLGQATLYFGGLWGEETGPHMLAN